MEAVIRTRRWSQIGLFGALVMLIGSLVSSPASAPGALVWADGAELLSTVEPIRAMIGAALGPLGAAFALGGCVGVFWILQPAGPGVALVPAAGLAQWFVGYGAYLAGRPFIGLMTRLVEPAGQPELLTLASTYLNVHRALGGVGLFVGSMFFFFTVLFRPTLLPRGAAAIAPVLWMPLIRTTPLWPSGGGAFWFAYPDLVAVLFFAALVALAGSGTTRES